MVVAIVTQLKARYPAFSLRFRIVKLTSVSSTPPFIQSAKRGDLEEVRSFLRNGLPVDSVDEHGYTMLHEAAEFGHPDLFWHLVAHGADVSAATPDGYGVVHAIALGGTASMLSYAVGRGESLACRVHAGEHAGFGPLDYARLGNNVCTATIIQQIVAHSHIGTDGVTGKIANAQGMLYFGTRIKNLVRLDSDEITRPLVKKAEELISVSVSGYRGMMPVTVHPEIKVLADTLIEDGHAELVDGHLAYRVGYNHSLTAYHGFGPSKTLPRNVFSNKDLTGRNRTNIAAVLANDPANLAGHTLDRSRSWFEYLSLSLHEFVHRISPELIVGWIVSRENVAVVREWVETNAIRPLPIWAVQDL